MPTLYAAYHSSTSAGLQHSSRDGVFRHYGGRRRHNGEGGPLQLEQAKQSKGINKARTKLVEEDDDRHARGSNPGHYKFSRRCPSLGPGVFFMGHWYSTLGKGKVTPDRTGLGTWRPLIAWFWRRWASVRITVRPWYWGMVTDRIYHVTVVLEGLGFN